MFAARLLGDIAQVVVKATITAVAAFTVGRQLEQHFPDTNDEPTQLFTVSGLWVPSE